MQLAGRQIGVRLHGTHLKRVAVPARRVVIVRAANATKPPPKKEEDAEKVDKVVEQLKKTGMTAAKAKEVLKAWTSVGVSDPEQLKKLLVSRSLAPIPGLALQSLFDGVACFGGFYIGNLAANAPDFPFRIVLEVLGYFLGIYYFVQVLLEVTVIGGLVYTSYKYGTSSGQLLAAVQSLAGPSSGVRVVDKAQEVVNVLKVISTLESVASMLNNEFKDPPKGDSLRNLGAYLTLSQAREQAGFKPEDYGLTDREAGNIAYAFSMYDTNSNYKLEPSELSALCSSLGKELNDAEVKEAVKMLDKNNNGYIEFNEFVDWWIKKGTGSSSSSSTAAQQEAKN